MNIEEKINKLGRAVLDELLQHRNISLSVEVRLEDTMFLDKLIVCISPNLAILSFDESEIADFYRLWAKTKHVYCYMPQ